MRHILFRQWNAIKKRYQYDIGAVADGHWQGPSYCSWEHYPLEQSTGLYDKNGKEIFEGDILKSSRAYRYMYNAGYIGDVKYREHFADYEYGLLGGQLTQTKAKYCEVIGTIHDTKYER